MSIHQLKRDDEYKSYRNIVEGGRRKINFAAEREKVSQMHGTRKTLLLSVAKERYSPRFIYDAIQTDMSYRGHLTTMVQKAQSLVMLLDEATAAFRSYVVSKYGDSIEGRTKEERSMRLDRICRPGLDLIGECDSHIEYISIIIKDIDQASFHYDRLVKVLEMIQEKGIRNI